MTMTAPSMYRTDDHEAVFAGLLPPNMASAEKFGPPTPSARMQKRTLLSDVRSVALPVPQAGRRILAVNSTEGVRSVRSVS
jgi:hypothetical protein